jgi:hypothetical protein
MRTTVIIKNLKCDDCKNTVVSTINKFEQITNVVTDIKIGSLSFDYTSHNVMEGLRIRLAEIGYPITSDPRVIIENLS